MPLPAAVIPLAAAAVSAGAGLAQNYFNVNAQNRANQQSEAFSREMYEKQRQDNLSQWHLQNQYNSPVDQMARLRQAGLNPNLVYAKGADNMSAPIASPSAPSYTPTAPRIDLAPVSSSLDNYYNYALKDAQIDNVKAQTTVSTQEAALKAAHIANVNANTSRSTFDLGLATELRQNSADMARESLRKLQADTNFQLSENERRLITTSQSVLESAERILSSRAQRANTKLEYSRIQESIKSLQNDNQLKALDIELRRNGINPNDPIYLRVLGRLLGSATENPIWDTVGKSIKNWWDK